MLELIARKDGLPRPQAQRSLYDDEGTFVARPDFYYSRERLALEYDGGGHRDTLAADNRRQNRMTEAGFRVLRFTAGDILNTPLAVASLVRRALDSYSIGSPN